MEDKLLADKLHEARRDLLDLSNRNRLLHTPRWVRRGSAIEVVGEDADDVYRILVQQNRSMWFRPVAEDRPLSGAARTDVQETKQPSGPGGGLGEGGPSDAERQNMATDTANEVQMNEDDSLLLPQPDKDDAATVEAVHGDRYLQTALSSKELQRRLLRLYYDARTYEEENGVGILFLAMGFLTWYEEESSRTPRHAPLILIPVQLERDSAASRFRLSYTGEELSTNLSLQERLRVDFHLQLPPLSDDDDFVPSRYAEEVRQAVRAWPEWTVDANAMVLWFFSFSKFLMFRDLDPANWPESSPLLNQPLVRGLLLQGFSPEKPIFHDHQQLDEVLDPRDLIHVLDADSSQTEVIEEVKGGRNLVVQGPPGTGKSQTIANILAAAVHAKKTVLFVAEKLAALQVVKRRLDHIGLGAMCLELHSRMANKKAVLEELRRTIEPRAVRQKLDDKLCEKLRARRDQLNAYVRLLHTPIQPSDVTPYEALGRLIRHQHQGLRPPTFRLPDAAAWTKAKYDEQRAILEELGRHSQQLGVPAQHPWRGVHATSLLASDIERLVVGVVPLVDRLQTLQRAASRLAELLEYGPVETLGAVSHVARFAAAMLRAPADQLMSLQHPVWDERRSSIVELVQQGRQRQELRQALAGRVVDEAWSADVRSIRHVLANYGVSWRRWLMPRYWRAVRAMRGLVKEPLPRTLSARLDLLDNMDRCRQLEDYFHTAETQELGRHAFGPYWHGVDSDWNMLQTIVDWEQECRQQRFPRHFPRLLEVLALRRSALSEQLSEVRRYLQPTYNSLSDIFRQLELDVSLAFGCSTLADVAISTLIERLTQWQQHPDQYHLWVGYLLRYQRARQSGLSEFADRMHNGDWTSERARHLLEMTWSEELLRAAFARHPELARFDGMTHEQVITEFQQLDRDRLNFARHQVAESHSQLIPYAESTSGEMGELNREFAKKRRHLPLRQLFRRAGRAIQRIKPVFMMSPLSVAQYLEPGAMEFDLVVMDEASQIRPVDALGAIARAKQLVVVGDDRQLPPTAFFERVLQDDGGEQADTASLTADVESILDLCKASGISQRMLRWHYRSRHPSLIAVSNTSFYDNRLWIVPSPNIANQEQGLHFYHVKSGIFDRGKTATNVVEARIVADAVMEHASRYPHKSLGVGTFSVSQRDMILDEIERRRRNNPQLESFFSPHGPEPFFVKNLENIQGDERDVIFISVGYGRDASGYLTMNFGPLNNAGGERRLNVLITRARERCCVFSSITHEDIDLTRTNAWGVRALQQFLQFAATGRLDLATPSGKDFQSEFEAQVARTLEQHGFTVHPQIGSSGFFIDLAVVDPEQPGRYLLGIECDGANYHRSRWATDRDRLRQQVLEDQGWVIHRVWSLDWYRRPGEEMRKVIGAIEHARSQKTVSADCPPAPIYEPPEFDSEYISDLRAPRSEGENDTNGETNGGSESDGGPIPTVAYREAQIVTQRLSHVHHHAVQQVLKLIQRVIDEEGPLHIDELTRRVVQCLGSTRVTRQVQQLVEQALSVAVQQHGLVREGAFVYASLSKIPIRNRAHIQSTSLRSPDKIPPREIQAALCAALAVHIGMTRDETITSVARLLGFRTTSPRLRSVIDEQLNYLLSEKRAIYERDGRLYVQPSATQAGP